LEGRGNTLSSKLLQAYQAEAKAINLARDIKTLVVWLDRDILNMAGACFQGRQGCH